MIYSLNEKKRFDDGRGSLSLLFEDNNTVLKRSYSIPNVFRGMHIQTDPFPQTKIIRLLKGRIIDLVYNPRTKIVHYKEISSEDDWHKINHNVAHGFYTLEETVFEYFCIGKYNEESERCYNIINPFCEYFDISKPIVSDKDNKGQVIKSCQFKKV